MQKVLSYKRLPVDGLLARAKVVKVKDGYDLNIKILFGLEETAMSAFNRITKHGLVLK